MPAHPTTSGRPDTDPTVFLVGGGWSPEHRDAVWGPFLRSAARRASGREPEVACVLVDEGDGRRQVQRWMSTLTATGGCSPVPVLIPRGSTLTEDQRAVLTRADGLLVCGGLTPAYADSLCDAADLFRGRVGAGVPYAGFSAGAAGAAARAIVGGWRHRGTPVCPEDAGEDLDEVTVVDGLGLTSFSVDVHAAQWGTLARLVAAVADGRVASGIALDEDTVVQLAADGSAVVAGNGKVHLVRPSGSDAGEVLVRSFPAGATVSPPDGDSDHR